MLESRKQNPHSHPPAGAAIFRTLGSYSLSWHSPIREWLRRQENGTEGATPDVLMDLLEGPFATRCQDRAVGFALLGDLELTAQERARAVRILCSALAIHRNPVSLVRKYRRSVRPAFFAAVVLTVAINLNGAFSDHSVLINQSRIQVLPPFAAMAFVMFLLVLVPRDKGTNSSELQAAMDSAVMIGGPDCLAAIYRHSRQRLSSLQKSADRALDMLMPTIGSQWAGRLPRDAAAVVIARCSNECTASAEAALDALERAGDATAASHMLKLAKRARDPHIRQKAESLATVLQGRKVIERDPHTLLRAGREDAHFRDLATSLLKPADPIHISEQLVLPANAPE